MTRVSPVSYNSDEGDTIRNTIGISRLPPFYSFPSPSILVYCHKMSLRLQTRFTLKQSSFLLREVNLLRYGDFRTFIFLLRLSLA